MAIGDNSYGSTAQVASFTPRYKVKGGVDFDDSTRPALAEVEGWIDQVSATLNSILADERFSVPVTQADALSMLSLFVNQEVAAIVEGTHNSGRFGPTAKTMRNGRFQLILKDVREFIHAVSGGLEGLGVPRSTTQTNVGSVALTRADGYSNDKNAVESSLL